MEAEINETQNTPMVIGEDWYCYNIDFDANEPHILLCRDDNSEEVKIPVPKQLVYYLKTHWCGSQEIHDKIVEKAKREWQYELRELLGIEIE